MAFQKLCVGVKTAVLSCTVGQVFVATYCVGKFNS